MTKDILFLMTSDCKAVPIAVPKDSTAVSAIPTTPFIAVPITPVFLLLSVALLTVSVTALAAPL
jgi:hypothetical protein